MTECAMCSQPIPAARGPMARYCSVSCRRQCEFELRRLDMQILALERSKTATHLYGYLLKPERLADDMRLLDERLAELRGQERRLIAASEGEVLPGCPPRVRERRIAHPDAI